MESHLAAWATIRDELRLTIATRLLQLHSDTTDCEGPCATSATVVSLLTSFLSQAQDSLPSLLFPLLPRLHSALLKSATTHSPCDIELLRKAVDVACHTLHLCSPRPESRGVLLKDLGASFRWFRDQPEHPKDGDHPQTTALRKRAISLLDWAISFDSQFTGLADHLWGSTKATLTTSQNRIEAIHHDLLDDYLPAAKPERAAAFHDLTVILWRSHLLHTDEKEELDTAVDIRRQAFSSLTAAHPNWLGACESLAESLEIRFRATGQVMMLDLFEAIQLRGKAQSTRAASHPDWARLTEELATTLQWRSHLLEEIHFIRELDTAIIHRREALQHRASSSPEWASACHALASALRVQFSRTGLSSDLMEAMDLEQTSLAVLRHPHPALSYGNLAALLQARARQTGDQQFARDAMIYGQEALKLHNVGDSTRALLCSIMASTLRVQFEFTDDALLLQEAIVLGRESLKVLPVHDIDRAAACSDLASSLCLAYQKQGDLIVLKEAIALEQDALKSAYGAYGHDGRARSLLNLAACVWELYLRTKIWITSVTEGALPWNKGPLVLYQLALDELSRNHPCRLQCIVGLAGLYLGRDSSFRDYSVGLSLLEELRYPGAYLGQLVMHTGSVCRIISQINTSRLSLDNLTALLDIAKTFVEILPLLGSIVLHKTARLSRMNDAASLPPAVFSWALQKYNPRAALELTEQARAVIWSQSLSMHQLAARDHVPAELRYKLQQLLAMLRSEMREVGSHETTRSSLRYRLQQHETHDRFHDLLNQIREVTRQPNFMRGLSYIEILNLAHDHPVVIVGPNMSGDGLHAYWIGPQDRYHFGGWKNITGFNMKFLDDIAFDVRSTIKSPRGDSGCDSADDHTCARGLDQPTVAEIALRKLWRRIVKPVLKGMGLLQTSTGRDRPRLHWYPLGIATFLPFHAAGVYTGGAKECCADYVVSSYTPSFSALKRARNISTPVAWKNVTMLAAAADETSEPHMTRLKQVQSEIAQVTELVRHSNPFINVIRHGCELAASVQEVTNVLPQADIVHLACHGKQDAKQPLESGFCLRDGRLTVSALMDIQLDRARLAFLSACETAKGDSEQPDQTVHLAAALLSCGFGSVIATMWSIYDADGPEVAKAVYEILLQEEQLDPRLIPYALDAAAHKLRKNGLLPAHWASFVHFGA